MAPKKRVPPTRSGSTPTSAFASGAARASDERDRRRSTPLLTAAVEADELAAEPVVVDPSPGEPSPGKPSPGKPSPGEAAAPPAETTVSRRKHRPVPTVTSAPSTKARRQSGERRQSGQQGQSGERRQSGQGRQSGEQGQSAARRQRGERRPSTERSATPPPRAAGEAPVPSQRPTRRTPRQKRLADDKVGGHLRLAPEPGTRQPAGRPGGTAAPLDPTLSESRGSLPIPRLEEILTTAIALMRSAASAAGLSPEEIERRIAHTLAFVRRRIEGDYTVDEFGYDEHFAENVILPLLRPIYHSWFRVEVRGAENVPAQGPALVVANHSGTVAVDSLMLQVALHDETPAHRVMRALGADLVFATPILGTWARRGGSTLATNVDADRLFTRGELVGVFPEGFKGVGKPFSERYKLQRFGRGGFVASALKAQVPIIPVSIVGAEEIAPIIGNLPTLARLFGAPYFPVTPTFPWLGPLGLIPLPSKWIIEFGAPIRTDTFGEGAAEDPMLVFDLTDQVRETIQQTLYALLMRRRSVFF